MRKILWFAGWYAGLSLLFGAICLIVYYPDLPSSPLGWIGVFLFPLPLLLLFEWLGNRISDNAFARRLDAHTSAKRVSLLRITYGVVAYCALILSVLALAYGWALARAYLGW